MDGPFLFGLFRKNWWVQVNLVPCDRQTNAARKKMNKQADLCDNWREFSRADGVRP